MYWLRYRFEVTHRDRRPVSSFFTINFKYSAQIGHSIVWFAFSFFLHGIVIKRQYFIIITECWTQPVYAMFLQWLENN